MTVITQSIAERVLSVVDKGLVRGMGQPIPGKMCVEAAVCFALGQEHGDNPSCVEDSLRRFKININDSGIWSSDHYRAKGLRRLAIAQLGTFNNFDQIMFLSKLKSLISSYAKSAEITGIIFSKDAINSLKYIDNKDFNVHDRISLSAYSLSHIACSYDGLEMQEHIFTKMCEEVVQILVEMNTPGSKFLYLTE